MSGFWQDVLGSKDKLFSEGITRIGRLPDLKIDIENLEFEKFLGRGGFGVVFAAVDCAEDMVYAVKKMRISKKYEEDRERARQELEIAKSLKHENIAGAYDAFMTENSAYLIMDVFENGNLSTFVTEHYPLEARLLKSLIKQMVDAVSFLHSKKIGHQDIKPHNFLLDKDLTIKLCDFGLSGKFDSRCQGTTGTPLYCSPQVAKEDYNPFKLDVWALGVTIYEIATNSYPHGFITFKELAYLPPKFEVTIPEDVPVRLNKLIKNMMKYDEVRRFNIKRVAQHEYFEVVSEVKSKTRTKSFRLTRTVGTLATDAISSLLQFDYFCEKHSEKSSMFVIIGATTEEVVSFLKDIFNNQEITFEQTKNKFKCRSKMLTFLADVKPDFLKTKSTIKFLRLVGIPEEFFKHLRNIFAALLDKI